MQAQATAIRWRPRGFEDADFEKASTLRKLFVSDEGSQRRSCEAEYYRWKLVANPSGRGLFKVADDTGRVVGITTITPKRVYLRGRLISGAEIGDTFTHPDYQRQGMFSTLVDLTRAEALSEGLEFIYGTPNDQSRPGYEKKLNFAQIPSSRVFSYVRPLNVGAVLLAHMGKPVLAKVLAPAVSAALRTVYRFRSTGVKDLKVSSVSEFPEDVINLWNICSGNYSWILRRDKEYLDWRFVSNPDRYTIWLASRNGETAGYLVTREGSFGKLRVGYLADFLVREDFPKVFQSLLFAAASSMRRADVDFLATWVVKASSYERVLSRFGFFPFKPVPIICYKNNVGLQCIQGEDRWHFTMADSDNI
jgi:GNAT superfamily N-acetyltransferase